MTFKHYSSLIKISKKQTRKEAIGARVCREGPGSHPDITLKLTEVGLPRAPQGVLHLLLPEPHATPCPRKAVTPNSERNTHGVQATAAANGNLRVTQRTEERLIPSQDMNQEKGSPAGRSRHWTQQKTPVRGRSRRQGELGELRSPQIHQPYSRI